MISIPGSLSFVMSSAPAKESVGDVRCASQDPSTHDKSHKISTQICIRSAFFLRRTQLISIAYFPYKQGNDQLHITMCTPKKIGQLKFIAIRKMQWEYGKLKLKTCLFKKGFETSLESVHTVYRPQFPWDSIP